MKQVAPHISCARQHPERNGTYMFFTRYTRYAVTPSLRAPRPNELSENEDRFFLACVYREAIRV